MNKSFLLSGPIILFLLLSILQACNDENPGPSKENIEAINLKRGAVILCGRNDTQFGAVDFQFSGNQKVKEDFNLAIKMLHSFEYDEAEKVFAKVIDQDPQCAMAYWGVAMSNFHALWTPPSEAELKKGAKALEIGQSINSKSQREKDYLNALSSFYNNWQKVDHRTRCLYFESAMKNLSEKYKGDKEAAIFYALALNAAADPADKTFAKQKKAGAILAALYPGEPDHPGIVHYLIHTYDSPELAEMALPAARKYASVAPSSAHALHMPSHIFTRLGLWDECIHSNLTSVSAAKCYAEEAGIKGHWDEELHGMDYLVYAYLQQGKNEEAQKQWDYLKTIKEVSPLNFKVAYAFASIPSRYVLENRMWKEASTLAIHKEDFAWENFQWQKAIIHFTRVMGSVHTENMHAAKKELEELDLIHTLLKKQKDTYKAAQVEIQKNAAEAWILFKEGKKDEALRIMNLAADLEDKTEKHPVTPGEVLPARELLGDMLMQLNHWDKALQVYEANLKKHPNRFNGLFSAGLAAEKGGQISKATLYYNKLLAAASGTSNRPEINIIKTFLKNPANQMQSSGIRIIERKALRLAD